MAGTLIAVTNWWDDAKPLDTLTVDELARTDQVTVIENPDGTVDMVMALLPGSKKPEAGIRRLAHSPSDQELDRLLAGYGRALKWRIGPWAPMEHGGRIRAGWIWSTEQATKQAIAQAKSAASRETERAWLRGLALAGAALLVLATTDLEYDYYVILRWAMGAIAIATGILSAELNKEKWLPGIIAIGVLWNPLIPVELDRSAWLPLDLLGAAYLAMVAFIAGKKSSPAGDGK